MESTSRLKALAKTHLAQVRSKGGMYCDGQLAIFADSWEVRKSKCQSIVPLGGWYIRKGGATFCPPCANYLLGYAITTTSDSSSSPALESPSDVSRSEVSITSVVDAEELTVDQIKARVLLGDENED